MKSRSKKKIKGEDKPEEKNKKRKGEGSKEVCKKREQGGCSKRKRKTFFFSKTKCKKKEWKHNLSEKRILFSNEKGFSLR